MAGKFEILYTAISLTTDENHDRAESASVPYYASFDAEIDEGGVVSEARAFGGIPQSYLGMRLDGVSIDERISPTKWKLTAEYKYPSSGSLSDNDEVPPESVQFDLGTSSEHVTMSRKTVRIYGKQTDLNGAINLQYGDDAPRGTDIMMPTATMTIKKYFRPSQFNATLYSKIMYRRGRVNSREFMGFKKGELLFLGAQISRNGTGRKDLWEVTYNFSISENETNVEIAGMESNVDKKGWEYMWVRFRQAVTFNNGPEMMPESVYIEELYKYADFSELGLSARSVF